MKTRYLVAFAALWASSATYAEDCPAPLAAYEQTCAQFSELLQQLPPPQAPSDWSAYDNAEARAAVDAYLDTLHQNLSATISKDYQLYQYAETLWAQWPALSVSIDTINPESAIDLGSFSARVTIDDEHTILDWVLPEHIDLGEGKEQSTLRFVGAPRVMIGINAHKTFEPLLVDIPKVTVKPQQGEAGIVSINAIQAYAGLSVDENQQWTQPMHLSIGESIVNMPQESVRLRIGNIISDWANSGEQADTYFSDLAAFQQSTQQWQAALQNTPSALPTVEWADLAALMNIPGQSTGSFALNDISATIESTTVELAQIAATTDIVNIGEDGGMQGDADWSLSGLSVELPEDGSVKLANVGFTMSISGSDNEALFGWLGAMFNNAGDADRMIAELPTALLAAYNAVSELRLEGRLSEFDNQIQMPVQIGSFKDWIHLKNRDDMSLNLGLEIGEAELPPLFIPADATPHAARLEIDLSRLPKDLIAQSVAMALEGNVDMLPLIALQQIFEAASRVQLIDTYVQAESTGINIDFDGEANASASYSAVGDLLLEVRGMDRLLEVASQIEPAAGAAAVMLLAMSNRTEVDGNTLDSFALKLNEQGQLTLNGKDMTPMLEQLFQ